MTEYQGLEDWLQEIGLGLSPSPGVDVNLYLLGEQQEGGGHLHSQ